MKTPIDPIECCAEIRAAIGIVALLRSGGELSDADMRAAVNTIEANVALIELAICDAGMADATVQRMLPVLSLADVAALAGHHARHRAEPHLQLLQGGRS